MLTIENGRKAYSETANARRKATIEDRRRFQQEDVILLRRRGLVPVAIADALGIGLRRVVEWLEGAGENIPSYLTTSSAPPREDRSCRHCGGPTS
jgi:hypothetical protein